jgi:cobalt-zinc-cadmium efflux system protein
LSHHHDEQKSTKQLKIAFFLNLFFTIVEIVGGFMTNSMAILSDALHDLGDSFSLGLAWYLDRYSTKAADEKFSYGYKRFSVLAALVNTIVLIVGSVFIISEAIPRIVNPEHSHATGMVVFAIMGIIINGIAVLNLKGGHSINLSIVMWHLLEDVLGWVAVLIVGIVLLFKDIHILDPLLSILITLYVLYNVIKNLSKTLLLFLQGVPENISIAALEATFSEVHGVINVHHTHVWSLDGERNVLTTHIVVDQNVSQESAQLIKQSIIKKIKPLNLEHSTIEIEYKADDCSMNNKKEI